MFKIISILTVLGLWNFAAFAAEDDLNACKSSPAKAVLQLPADLERLGAELYCTQYGHVIAANKTWIWTRPGAFSPVWIPAQMVRENPKTLGNQAYFTRIATGSATEDEVRKANTAFRVLFPEQDFGTSMLRLNVDSYPGRSLELIFVNGDGAPWGVWCSTDQCDPDSVFMLLDMSKAPPNTGSRGSKQ